MLRSTLGDVPLDVERAQRICCGILKGAKGRRGQFRNLFSAFPEVDVEDLEQEMMLAICRRWCHFDPDKAAPVTYMHRTAQSAMLDTWRRCKSGKAKVRRRAAQMEERDFWHHDPDPAQADRPLEEMLAENLVITRKIFNKRRYRRGRKDFNAPQLMAIAMLMRQAKIGSRRCRKVLLARADLCEIVNLKRVPSVQWLEQTAAKLRRFEAECVPAAESLPDGDEGVVQGKEMIPTGVPGNVQDVRRCVAHGGGNLPSRRDVANN